MRIFVSLGEGRRNSDNNRSPNPKICLTHFYQFIQVGSQRRSPSDRMTKFFSRIFILPLNRVEPPDRTIF